MLLEAVGEGIMKRISLHDIGTYLVSASEQIQQLGILLQPQQQIVLCSIDSNNNNNNNNNVVVVPVTTATTASTQSIINDASERLLYSADTMKLAGNQLIGTIQQQKSQQGRSFLKGGM
jgi:hypothetical protein